MEPIPNITMQCPKCRKSFPMDVLYCEVCTAMLEPVEQDAGQPAPASSPGGLPPKEGTAPVGITTERMEDVALDSLRADVERKFIFTLLLELDQARKRLEKKEGILSGIMEKQASMDHRDFVTQSGGVEDEMDGLIKKIARTEAMLENLTEKIKTDLGGLEAQLSGLAKPGVSEMFGSAGKYYRMLSSELKTKRALLRMLSDRRPPAFPTFTRLKAVLIPAAVLLFIAAAGLAAYLYLPGDKPSPVHATHTAAPQPSPVTQQEISGLLDDIRKANLTKDISLWESRYSRAYLAQKDKREGILDQWSKVDYISLAYTVDEIRSGASNASAVVTWNMDVVSKADGSKKTVVQRLLAEFAREDGTLKIAAVRKK